MVLCECGCGREVKPGRLFILGHNNRKPKLEPKLCECGCGKLALPGNRFIHGHNRKNPEPEPLLCECGCGGLALPGNRFIRNHQNRKPKPESQLCECGCEEYAKPGYRFIYGHANKGRNFSLKWRKNMSMGHEGIPLTPEHCTAIGRATSKRQKDAPLSTEHCLAISISKSGENNPMYGKHHSVETIKKMKEAMVKHHYIYDHSDLSKYTMEVTRDKHAKIHMWMRKAGIKVPHINMKEE